MLADQCEVARTFLSRGCGLLGRSTLPAGSGLLIEPCSSIHMLFMRFPIDAIFVDRQGQVVALYPSLPPWRLYAGHRRARYVLELPVGVIAATQTTIGDRIAVQPVTG
ncbi:DUF192 domain-containing protein [Chloroflexus sp.]|uniref:DUF192 domain-containing protein n=1 Tax=Chloroflexus sp. TaxID=1904827 RepID=UPI002ACD39BD|nr:DUF192 domain-containing protein [Chloroflexus sp.]